MIDFDPNNDRDCLSRDEIYKYISDRSALDVGLLRSIEQHLIDCDLCSGAIEGYMFLKNEDPESFERVFSKPESPLTELPSPEKKDFSERLNTHEIEPDSTHSGKVFHLPLKPDPSVLSDNAEGTEIRVGRNNNTKPINFFIRRIAAVGLFFILIAGITYYFKDNSKDLLSLYGNGSEYALNLRGEHSIDSAIDKAFTAFSQEKYNQSAADFQRIFNETDQENLSVSFYLGISYMNLKTWEPAEEYLTKTANSNNEFSPDAKYYLSKIYLAKGQRTKAKEILDELRYSERNDIKEKVSIVLEQWE